MNYKPIEPYGGGRMYKAKVQAVPSEVFEGLFVACLAVGLIAGIVFGFRLYNSIVST